MLIGIAAVVLTPFLLMGAMSPVTIPAALTQHFECVTWPLAAATAGARKDARVVRVDVGAKMRSMWR